jgi:hypothetical protein
MARRRPEGIGVGLATDGQRRAETQAHQHTHKHNNTHNMQAAQLVTFRGTATVRPPSPHPQHGHSEMHRAREHFARTGQHPFTFTLRVHAMTRARRYPTSNTSGNHPHTATQHPPIPPTRMDSRVVLRAYEHLPPQHCSCAARTASCRLTATICSLEHFSGQRGPEHNTSTTRAPLACVSACARAHARENVAPRRLHVGTPIEVTRTRHGSCGDAVAGTRRRQVWACHTVPAVRRV